MPPSGPRAVRLALALGCLIALVPLAWLDPEHRQLLPFAGWLAAMVLYLLLWPRPHSSPRWQPPAGLSWAGQRTLAIFVIAIGLWVSKALPLMVTSMLLFGGETLHYFALALTIGILFSIYSSVLVASPLLMMFGVSREDFIKPEKPQAEEVLP